MNKNGFFASFWSQGQSLIADLRLSNLCQKCCSNNKKGPKRFQMILFKQRQSKLCVKLQNFTLYGKRVDRTGLMHLAIFLWKTSVKP